MKLKIIPYRTQTDTNVTTISSITLMDGDASSLATVLTNILDSSVAASALTYTWSVPSNLSVREDCKFHKKTR